jgi:uncharacterized protein YndB with AHSA1/START domain
MSPSTDYEFITIWQLEAPIEEVWEELHHSERWPQWWKGVESVIELRAGDESGVGALHRCVWKSRLPYKLAFNMQTTRVQSPHTLEGVARGELEGTGRWRLSHKDGITTVRYTWQVRTTKPWMRVLAPLARPIFEWNHDVVMRQGGRRACARPGRPVGERGRRSKTGRSLGGSGLWLNGVPGRGDRVARTAHGSA